MGLRINTNTGALTFIRNLNTINNATVSTLEKLATGRAINRASDNPSAQVLLEQLNAQLNSIEAASKNAQSANNMIATVEAALAEISNQLNTLQANFVAAQNSGALSEEARGAIQDVIDQTVSGIDRIASTTRFAGTPLLSGSLSFQVSNQSPQITNLNVFSTAANIPAAGQNINVNVIAAATKATATGTIGAVQSGSTILLSGSKGSVQIDIPAGATQAEVVDIINGFSQQTGVIATPGGLIQSANVGSSEFVNIAVLSGTFNGITPGLTKGTDVVATVNGQNVSAQGNNINVSQSNFSGSFTVQQGFTGTASFTIKGGGATFQIGTNPADAVRIGIPGVNANLLGSTSGTGNLNQLKTGGAFSTTGDFAGALNIIGAAQNEISRIRSALGSVSKNVFEATTRSLGVAFENLSRTRSAIGDTEFSSQISNLVRNRILQAATISGLRTNQLVPGSVINLLA